ncbi:MAG: efflux RND transporter permease subunit [Smithella sp.]
MKGLIARYLEKPYLVLSIVLVLAIVGLIGYSKMPLNLYPDTDRPQIMVITVQPGASAADVEAKTSRTIEKELSTLGSVVRVSSTSKDEVSVVNVEFDYTTSLNAGATDVANALSKIAGQLPSDIRPPQVYKISQASQPTVVLSLSPKDNSLLGLAQIRQLADNEIKEELLRVPNIAQVEVFGGLQSELKIVVNPEALVKYGLTIGDVAAALNANSVNVPDGLIIKDSQQLLLKTQGEFSQPEEATNIVIARRQTGDIYLRDVASLQFGSAERQSAYHGNGHPAVGVSILRSVEGHTLDTVRSIEGYLPTLREHYPGIEFQISDTQGTLIRTTIANMQDALRDAIILTILVVFLFLGNMRVTLLAAISIPFTYLLTFAALWMIGYELNMIVLTGVILAVGMLLDDAIVVIENIARHYEETPERLKQAVIGGTEEVLVAIFSGTYATVMVLIPIIFIGGYVQKVMAPLALPMCISLVASYIVSVTIIPLAAPILLRAKLKPNFIERLAIRFDEKVMTAMRQFFVTAAKTALKHKALFIMLAIIMFIVSVRQMPLVGREVQASMDTGIIKVNFESDTDMSLVDTEQVVSQMEAVILKLPGLETISTVVGSESGAVSFGNGKLPQAGNITIRLVDHFHRQQDIWSIENYLRQEFASVPGLKYADVFDYGATPMASIKASVDVMISGPDRKMLDKIGQEIYDKMYMVGGLTSVSRSWSYDKQEALFIVNKERCSLYEISPLAVSRQLAAVIRGNTGSTYRIEGEDGIMFRVEYPKDRRDDLTKLANIYIITPKGAVPLQTLGTLSLQKTPTLITRQGLQNTLDIYGYREKTAITHLDTGVQNVIKDIELPAGYSISQEGDIKPMTDSFKSLGVALAIGLILLYFSLVPAFHSFIHPFTIMSAIPFGVIGGIWLLLATGKHSSMSAFVGIILLAGIVVKNSILLIDFILQARRRGDPMEKAILDSVHMRTRPIVMTALGTAAGMVPIALQWAVGLERLSPLAVVTIGGLMVSTFLTLVYIPMLFTLFEQLKAAFKHGCSFFTKNRTI